MFHSFYLPLKTNRSAQRIMGPTRKGDWCFNRVVVLLVSRTYFGVFIDFGLPTTAVTLILLNVAFRMIKAKVNVSADRLVQKQLRGTVNEVYVMKERSQEQKISTGQQLSFKL